MKVDLFACNDGLEAKLDIRDFDRNEWRARFQGKESLLTFITGLGLLRELVETAAVESVCLLLGGDDSKESGLLAMNLKEAQTLTLASGRSPVHEEAEGLMFHKSYLSEGPDVASLKARIRESGFDEARKSVDQGSLVESGQSILSFISIREGQAGMDVFGKAVPFMTYDQFLPSAGRGIVKLDRKWVAKEAGVLVHENNTLKVLGEGGAQPGLIQVSEDKLKAWLVLQADVMQFGDDAASSLDSIKAAMAKMGLRPLRDESRVLSALDTFLREGGEQEVLLLEGVLSKRGKDGQVRLLINPEPDLPDPDTVQKMDFRAFTFFRTVKKGERLARVIPPEPGTGGMDVFGNVTLPTAGKPIKFILGKNTEFAADDASIIVAVRDGKLAVEEGVPHVVDTLKISEDVSFKTGNLSFPGSIEVEGNVLDKFTIEAKGDIGIGGVVENGLVVSEGAILIKGGVIGGGSGLIKSKLSSVTIGFIRNQRIESHSNIIVYNEVLNSQLFARKSILMKSGSHSVFGGTMVAFDSIEIHNAGNEAETKTILEVGRDFEVEAELARKREYLKTVRADLEFLEKKRDQLELIVRWEAGKKPENRLLEQRVKGGVTLLEKVRQGLTAKLNELEASLFNPGGCYIAVSGTAYPGTILKYRDRVIPITEPMRNKRWVFKGS